MVFVDTGVGVGGVANDGIRNGTEAGLANVTVRLTDSTGATTYATTQTNSSGAYTLTIPGSLPAGTVLRVVETNLAGYLSTGGQAGTTSGAYNRATDLTQFTLSLGTSYSGVNFADVPVNTFAPDGQQNALPGTVVFYAHVFTAGSGGTVSFTTNNVASPAIVGWSQTLYHDANCNATLESSEPQIISAITVTADTRICILVKEFVPEAAPLNATDLITVTATFTYTNATPALSASVSRTDLTIVELSAAAGLVLSKSVNKATALPGETLTYTITYNNISPQSLNTLVIYDTTPAFTTFVSATCNIPLPAALTACTVSTQPAVGATGAVAWTFTGALAPGSSGSVQWLVQVNP
jgi:uncharacterized repeat protein (TIGR01451 family)